MKTIIILTLAVSLVGWTAIAGAQHTSGGSPATGAERMAVYCTREGEEAVSALLV